MHIREQEQSCFARLLAVLCVGRCIPTDLTDTFLLQFFGQTLATMDVDNRVTITVCGDGGCGMSCRHFFVCRWGLLADHHGIQVKVQLRYDWLGVNGHLSEYSISISRVQMLN